jgi:phage baseplate assembly protein W
MAPQHLAIPYSLDVTGSAATVDQDSVADVAQCLRTLLSTPTNTRVEQWEYGIADPTFGQPSPPPIVAAINRWEPRAAGAHVTVTVAADGSSTITAQLPTEVGR